MPKDNEASILDQIDGMSEQEKTPVYEAGGIEEQIDNIGKYQAEFAKQKAIADDQMSMQSGFLDAATQVGSQFTHGVAAPFSGPLRRAGEAMGLAEEGSADRYNAYLDAQNQAIGERYYPEQGTYGRLFADAAMGAAQNAPTALIGGGVGGIAGKGLAKAGQAALGGRAAVATAQGFRQSIAAAKMGQLGAYGGQVGTFAASAADKAYTQAKSQGMTDDDAWTYALKQGAIEGGVTSAFNILGAGGVEKMVAKGVSKNVATEAVKSSEKAVLKAIKNFGGNLSAELTEELTIETLANVVEGENLDPTADNFDKMVETWAMTALQTVMMTGGMQAGGAAAQKAMEFAPGADARKQKAEEIANAQQLDLENERLQQLDEEMASKLGVPVEAFTNARTGNEVAQKRKPELDERLKEETDKDSDFPADIYMRFYAEGVKQEADILRRDNDFTEEDYDNTYGDEAWSKYYQEAVTKQQEQEDLEVAKAEEEAAEDEHGDDDAPAQDVDSYEPMGVNEEGQEIREDVNGGRAVNTGTEAEPSWEFQEPNGTDDKFVPVDEVEETSTEETPVPVAETPETVEETPETVEETSEPVVETPETVEETPEPVVETPEPVVETPETVVETPEAVVETPETVVETPEPVAETSESVEETTPEPVAETELSEEETDDAETAEEDWGLPQLLELETNLQETLKQQGRVTDARTESQLADVQRAIAELREEEAKAKDAEAKDTETKPLRSWKNGKENTYSVTLSETEDGRFAVSEVREGREPKVRYADNRKQADAIYSKQRKLAVKHNARNALRADDEVLGIERDNATQLPTEASLEAALDKWANKELDWQSVAKGQTRPVNGAFKRDLVSLETEPLSHLAQKRLASVYEEQGMSEQDANAKAKEVIEPWQKLFVDLRLKKEELGQRYATEREAIFGKGFTGTPAVEAMTSLESSIRSHYSDLIWGDGRKHTKKYGDIALTRLARGIENLEEGAAENLLEDAVYQLPQRELDAAIDEDSRRGKYSVDRGTRTTTETTPTNQFEVTSKLHMFGTVPQYWQATIPTDADQTNGRMVNETGKTREEAVEKAIRRAEGFQDDKKNRKEKFYTRKELEDIASLPSSSLKKRELRYIAAERGIAGAETLRFKTLVERILEDQDQRRSQIPEGPVQLEESESNAVRTVLQSKQGRNLLSSQLKDVIQSSPNNLSEGIDSYEAAIEQAISDALAALDGPIDLQSMGELAREALLRALDQDMSVILAPSTNEDVDILDMPTGSDVSKQQRSLSSAKTRLQEAMGILPDGAFIDEDGNLLVPLTVTASQFNDELDWWSKTLNPESKQNVSLNARANKQGMMTQEQADKVNAGWQEEIDSQSNLRINPNQREGSLDNSNKVIISLFDRTGEWARPWAEAGYTVLRYDVQEDGAVNDKGEPIHMGEFFQGSVEDVNWEEVRDFIYDNGQEVYGIIAGVPCTHFSRAGNKFWPEKDADGRTAGTNKEGPREGLNLLQTTMMLIEEFKPPIWAIENPMGRIQTLGSLPDPALRFQPANFGDPYDKETYLWGNMNTNLPLAPVVPVDGSKMHSDYGGKSLATKNARAETPKGFAKSFFIANNYLDAPAGIRALYDQPFFAPQIVEAVDAGLTYDEALEVVNNYDHNTHSAEEVATALNNEIYQKRNLAKLVKPKNVAALPTYSVYQTAKDKFLVRLDNNNELGKGDPSYGTREEAQAESDRLVEIAESQPVSEVDVETEYVDARSEKQRAKGKWQKALYNELFKKPSGPLAAGLLRDKHIEKMTRDELVQAYTDVFGVPPAVMLNKDELGRAVQGVRNEFDEAMRWLANGRRVTAREAMENFPNAFNMLMAKGIAGTWYDPQQGKLYGIPHAMLEQTLVAAFPEISRNSLDLAHEYMDAAVKVYPTAQQAEQRMLYIDPAKWNWNAKRKQILTVPSRFNTGMTPYELQRQQWEANQANGTQTKTAVTEAVDAAVPTTSVVPQDVQDALNAMIDASMEAAQKRKEEKQKKKKKLGNLDRTGQSLMFPGMVAEVNYAHDLAAFTRKYVGGEGGLVENLTDDHKMVFENEGGATQVAYDLLRSIWELRLDENMSPEATGVTKERYKEAGELEKQEMRDVFIDDFIRDCCRDINNQHKTVEKTPKLTATGKHKTSRGKKLYDQKMTRNVDRKSGAYWPDYLLDNLEGEVTSETSGWPTNLNNAMRDSAIAKWDTFVAETNKKKSVGKRSEKLADKAAKAKAKGDAALDTMLAKFKSSTYTGIGPAILNELGPVAVEYVVGRTQEKAYSFASFITMAAEEFGPHMEQAGELLEMTWQLLRERGFMQEGEVEYDEPQGSWRDQLDTDNNGIPQTDESVESDATEESSDTDLDNAIPNAELIANSLFGISPRSFFMSGMSRAPADIADAVAANRPIGVAYESVNKGKFEKLSEKVRRAMVSHVVDHQLPLFIDSGMFSRVINGEPGATPSWAEVMNFYDEFIDEVLQYAEDNDKRADLGLVAMVMPDVLVKQATGPLIVGLGDETSKLQKQQQGNINEIVARGASVIMPVQRPVGDHGSYYHQYTDEVLAEELEEDGKNQLFDSAMEFLDSEFNYRTAPAGNPSYDSADPVEGRVLTEDEYLDRKNEGINSDIKEGFDLGRNVMVGIPYGQSPWPDANILDFVARYRDMRKENGKYPALRLHLLGSGASRTAKLWSQIAAIDPSVELTGDSSTEVQNRDDYNINTGRKNQPYVLPAGKTLEAVLKQYWIDGGEATDLKKLRQTIYRSPELPETSSDRAFVDEEIDTSILEQFERLVRDNDGAENLQEILEDFFYKQPRQELEDNGNPTIFKEARDDGFGGIAGHVNGPLADMRIYPEDNDGTDNADDDAGNSGNQSTGSGSVTGTDSNNRNGSDELGRDNAGDVSTSEESGDTGTRTGDEGESVPEGTDETVTGGREGSGQDGRSSDGEQPSRDGLEPSPPSASVRPNYHLSEEKWAEIVGGGKKTKFNRNKEAIALVLELEASNAPPTPEQLDLLAGYTGWGQFGQELFQGSWENPRDIAEGWEAESEWLREHLGRVAWTSLRDSIVNAHYTAPQVVSKMWDMVRRLGFTGGSVLEPAVGSGNFLSVMPRDLEEQSQITGIDTEIIAAKIAKTLHPRSTILNHSYALDNAPDNHYDLVISNVPFGKIPLSDRKTKNMSIHNFFFEKALRQVKEGGLVAMVTSAKSLDNVDDKGYRSRWMAKADVVGVVRLPGDAFHQNAGTKVVTDIIIMRKRKEGEQKSDNALNIREANKTEVPNRIEPDKTGEVQISEYLIQNPQNILGIPAFGRSLNAPGLIVESHKDLNLADQLAGFVETLPTDIFNAQDTSHVQRKAVEDGDNSMQNALKFDPDLTYTTSYTNKEGVTKSATLQGGFVARRGNEWLPVYDDVLKTGVRFHRSNTLNPTLLQKQSDQLRGLVNIADKLQVLLDAQIEGEAVEERAALNEAYDTYFAEFGPINPKNGKKSPLINFMANVGDPRTNSVLSLDEGGKKNNIFDHNTVRVQQRLVEGEASLPDAFVYVRNKNPRFIDTAEIARLTGLPKKEVEQKLIDDELVYRTAGGNIESADIFLSGNVREKLLSLEQAKNLEGKRGLTKSIEALKGKIPDNVTYENITVNMGALWIESEIYSEYLSELSGIPADHIHVRRVGNAWRTEIDGRGLALAGESASDWTAPGNPFNRVANAALGKGTLRVMRTNEEGNKEYDAEASAQLNRRVDMMRTQFGYWVWADNDRTEKLEQAYNERYNSSIPLQPKNIPLTMEGLSNKKGSYDFDYRDHQKAAIYKGLVHGKGLFAHEVGTGKTLTMAGLALEAKRLGLANKPILLGHNANYEEVASAVREAYPSARILTVSNLNPAKAAQDLNAIGTGDWDLVIMPESQVENIKFKADTIRSIMQEMLDNLEAAARASQEDEDGAAIEWDMDTILEGEDLKNSGLKPTAKQLVRERWKIIAQIDEAVAESSVTADALFETWGVDMLLVDEVHKYKKLPIATKMNIKGLNRQGTKKSSQLYLASQYVQQMNNGRNVYTFTGTPITNTVSELFNQMRYIMNQEMKDADIGDWDGWFNTFVEASTQQEVSPGGQLVDVERIRNFVNVPELRAFMSNYLDTVFAEEMQEYTPRPNREGRTSDPAENRNVPYMVVENVNGDMTSGQKRKGRDLRERFQRWLDASGATRKEYMREIGRPNAPGTLNLQTNPLALDPRLVGEDADPDDPNLKVNKMVEKLNEVYQRDENSTQMIFLDQGWNEKSKRTVGREEDADGNMVSVKEEFQVFESKYTDSKVYVEEVIKKIIEKTGVPREQIAVFHNKNAKQKAVLSEKLNNGEMKFAIGSTETMGTGVNAQVNLRAIHHLDAPWTPAELEQRIGRIRRQGNEWNTVYQYRYLTQSPQEARRWSFLLAKLKMITDFVKNKDMKRTFELADDDDMGLLSAFDSALGDPRVIQKSKLKSKTDRLKQERQMFELMQGRQRSQLLDIKKSVPLQELRISTFMSAIRNWDRNPLTQAKDITGKRVSQFSFQLGSEPVTYNGLGWTNEQNEPTESLIGKDRINEFVADKYSSLSSSLLQGQQETIGQYRGNSIVVRKDEHYAAGLYLVPADQTGTNPMGGWIPLYPPTKQKNKVTEAGGAHNGTKLFIQGMGKAVSAQKSLMPNLRAKLEADKVRLEKFDETAKLPEFPKASEIQDGEMVLHQIDNELEQAPYGTPFWMQAALPIGQPFYYEGKKYETVGWRNDDEVTADTGEVNEEGLPVYTAFPAKDVTDAAGTTLVPELQPGYTGDNVREKDQSETSQSTMPSGVALLVNVPQSLRSENPEVGQFRMPQTVLLATTDGDVAAGQATVALKFGEDTVEVPAALFNMATRATPQMVSDATPSIAKTWDRLRSGELSINLADAARDWDRISRSENWATGQTEFLNDLFGGLFESYGFDEDGDAYTERSFESREEILADYGSRLQEIADQQNQGGGGFRSIGFRNMSPNNTRQGFPVNPRPEKGNQESDRGLDAEFSDIREGRKRKGLDKASRQKNRSARDIVQRLSRYFGVSLKYGTFHHSQNGPNRPYGYQSGLSTEGGEERRGTGAPRVKVDNNVRVRKTEVQNLAVAVHELAHGLDEIYGVNELFGEWETANESSQENFIERELNAVLAEAGDMTRLFAEMNNGGDFSVAIKKMIDHLSTDEMIQRRKGNPQNAMVDRAGNPVGELNDRSYMREAMKDFFTLYFMPDNDNSNQLRDDYDGYRDVEAWFNDNVMDNSSWNQSDMKRETENIQRKEIGELIELNHALKEMDYDQNLYSDTRTVASDGNDRFRVQRIHDHRRPSEGFAEFARAYMTQDESTWDDIPGFRTALDFFQSRPDFADMMERLTVARTEIASFRHKPELDRLNGMVVDYGNRKNRGGWLSGLIHRNNKELDRSEIIAKAKELVENLYRNYKDRARTLKVNADKIKAEDRRRSEANTRALRRDMASRGVDPTGAQGAVQDTFAQEPTAYEIYNAYTNTVPSFVDEALTDGVFKPNEILRGNEPVNRGLGMPTFYDALGQLEDDEDKDNADLYMVIKHQQLMSNRVAEDYRWPINQAEGQRWMDNLSQEQRDRYENMFLALNNMMNELRVMEYKMGMIGRNDVERMFKTYTTQTQYNEDTNKEEVVRDPEEGFPLADAYIPMERVKLDKKDRPVGGQRTLNTVGLARRAKEGSDREVVSPIATAIDKAFRSYAAANRHMAMKELIRSNQQAGNMGTDVTKVDPADRLNTVTIDEVMKSLVREGLITKGESIAIKLADQLFRKWNEEKETWSKNYQRYGSVNLTDEDVEAIAEIAVLTNTEIADIQDPVLQRDVENGLTDARNVVSDEAQAIIDMLNDVPDRYGLLHWNTEDIGRILQENENVYVLRRPARSDDTDIYGKPLPSGEMKLELFELSEELQKGIDVVHPWMNSRLIQGSRQINNYYKGGAVGFNPVFGAKQYAMDSMAAMFNSTEMGQLERLAPVIAAKSLINSIKEMRRQGSEYWGEGEYDDANEFEKLYRMFSGGMNPDMSMAMGEDKDQFISKTIKKKGFQKNKLADALKPLEFNGSVNPLKWSAGAAPRTLRELITSADAGPRKQEALAYLRNRGIGQNELGQFIDLSTGDRTRPSQKLIVGAINAANDVTYNYKRIGKLTQVIETVRPFTNAMMEGIDKAVRVISEDLAAPFTQRGVNTPEAEGRMRRAKANLGYFLAINTVAATLKLMTEMDDDDEDKELQDYLQANGLVMDFTGDGVTDVQLPGLRENSIRIHAGSLAVEIAKAAFGLDDRLSSAEEELIEGSQGTTRRMLDSLMHQTIDLTSEDLLDPKKLVAWIAQTGWAGMVTGLMTNRDAFRDSPIENPWDVVGNELKSERYNRSTTELFTQEDIKKFNGDFPIKMSPAEVDFATNQIGGGVIQRAADYGDLVFNGYNGYGEVPLLPYAPGSRAYLPARRQMQSGQDLFKHRSLLDTQKKTAERDGEGWTPEHETFFKRINDYSELYSSLMKVGRDARGKERQMIENMAVGLARAGLLRERISTGTDPMTVPLADWPESLSVPPEGQDKSFKEKTIALVERHYKNLTPPKATKAVYADGTTRAERIADDQRKKREAQEFFNYYEDLTSEVIQNVKRKDAIKTRKRLLEKW